MLIYIPIGVTFQNLVKLVFEKHIGRNVLVYVDDIYVKSATLVDHLHDLTRDTRDTMGQENEAKPKQMPFQGS